MFFTVDSSIDAHFGWKFVLIWIAFINIFGIPMIKALWKIPTIYFYGIQLVFIFVYNNINPSYDS